MPENDEVLPKYLRISGHIRDRIERGELAPGDEVPSERDLASQWRVARPTAAKALNTLRQQGIVESRRGSGTYVARRPRGPVADEHAPRYGSAYAEDASVTVLEAAVVTAPDHVAEVLGLPRGTAVLMRKRLTGNESQATEVATSWFAGTLAELAPRLLRTERLTDGTLRYLESVTDHRVSHLRDRVAARLATADERRHLALGRPAAVLVHQLTLHTADGAVLQLDEVVHPPAKWMFQQEYSTSS
ncbi:GntR family transcriptional regulator [Nocardia tenerifensis]|uniref:GntR family transcriptional regulator n=1 Tax=Nocardia tenerifensis TaxID=228006 RepID=A0A318K2J4_9NOCA|nr:GntR family transcriptional regulator [Nocardia tenerifensis]PXX65070.1 GntR family transcriptional regulator [Nocardia tenerifensis]